MSFSFKSLLFSGLFAFGTTTAVQAAPVLTTADVLTETYTLQNEPGDRTNPSLVRQANQQTAQLNQIVNLSRQQTRKVNAVYLNFARRAANMPAKKAGKGLQPLLNQRDAAINRILTRKQSAKLAATQSRQENGTRRIT